MKRVLGGDYYCYWCGHEHYEKSKIGREHTSCRIKSQADAYRRVGRRNPTKESPLEKRVARG